MPLMRPWLPVNGHPGNYAPLPPDVAFPATRGGLATLHTREARLLAGRLGVAGTSTMDRAAAINAIAQVIGFVAADIV